MKGLRSFARLSSRSRRETTGAAPAARSAAGQGRASVFVSYSTTDREFAIRLYALLEEQGRDVWIDWQSIPATTSWEEEIATGIDSADVFLIVLSPAWIDSKECRKELARARDRAKRLAPVLYLPVQRERVPEDVAAIQWTAANEATLVEGADGLAAALDADFEWIREHTRLLERALEWSQSGENRSRLLRGSDLVAADAWLARARAGKEPGATPPHVGYIDASRIDARRRRHRQFALAGAVTVAAAALATFGILQTNTASSRERLDESHRLAAKALATLASDPAAALDAALQAEDAESTPEAESALRTTLASDLRRASLARRGSTVVAAIFSPDGKLVLTGGQTLRLWNSRTGRFVRVLRGAGGWPATSPYAVLSDSEFAASFSRDGKLVIGGSDDRVQIWEASSGRVLRKLDSLDNAFWGGFGAVLSPDGKTVLGIDSDGAARLWDRSSRRLLHTLHAGPHSDSSFRGAVFSPDGKLVLTVGSSVDATHAGIARLWDRVTGASLRTVATDVQTAIFSPDGTLVLALNFDKGRALIRDTATGRARGALAGFDSPADSTPPLFSADGRFILGVTSDGARLWNSATGSTKRTFRDPTGVSSASFGLRGRLVLTAGEEGTVRFWDSRNGRAIQVLRCGPDPIQTATLSPDGTTVLTVARGNASLWDSAHGTVSRTFRGHRGAVATAAFSPDATVVLTAGAGKTARLWSSATGRPLHTLDRHTDRVTKGVFSPDGTLVLTASDDATARIWARATGKQLHTLREPLSDEYDFVPDAVFSPDGKLVLASHSRATPDLWDSSTGKRLRGLQLDPGLGSIVRVDFSPDGNLVVGAGPGGAALWDTSTGHRVHHLGGHVVAHGADGTAIRETFDDAAFSPDGALVVTAAENGTARLWDSASGRELRALAGHAGAVNAAAFSPDGALVVTAGADGKARLWDTATGRELRTLSGHSGAVEKGVFSPDGKLVLTAGEDGTARLWDASTGGLLRTFPGNGGDVLSAVFSPDGTVVLTASSDGTARIWACDLCGAPVEELVERAKERLAVR